VEHAFQGFAVPDEVLFACGGGEPHATFRTELHRRSWNYTYNGITVATAATGSTYVVSLPDPPMYPAHLVAGHDTYFTHLAGVLQACFSGWRGSVRHTVVAIDASASPVAADWVGGRLSVWRRSRDAPYLAPLYDQFAGLNAHSLQWELLDGGSDLTVSHGVDPKPVSVDVPYASQRHVAQPGTRAVPTSGAVAVIQGFTAPANNLLVAVYSSCGDDYQLFGWVGMPQLNPQTPSNTYASWV